MNMKKAKKEKKIFQKKIHQKKKWKREKQIDDEISLFFKKNKEKEKKQKKNKINNNNSTNTDKIIYNNCSRSTQYKKK